MQIKFVNYLPNKGHPNYVYYIKSEGKFYGWDIINLRFYNLSTPDFNDVLGLSLTNLQDGQVLTYNATTDLWENKEGAPTIQELSQIQDVYTPTYTNLGVLYRDTNDNLWKIATISDLLGYTPESVDNKVTEIIPELLDNSHYPTTSAVYNFVTSFGFVTNVITSLGYTPANKAGDTFTGSITATNLSGTNTGDETNATIKTKLGAATSLVDGYLTSTDWNTFNNKQSAISLTTTGSSGAATFSGNILNIPQYADTNLYNIDGSLTSNRIITLNSLNLTIAGTTSSVFFANGNIAIGSTTDAGFKLDVNGTTNITAQGALSTDIAFRVRNSANTGNILQVSGNGNVQVGVGGLSICRTDSPNGSLVATITYITAQTFLFSQGLSAPRYGDNTTTNSYIESKYYSGTWQVYGSGAGTGSTFLIKALNATASSFFFKLQNGTTDLLNLTTGGNLLLGTSTDAGFKLDVNGTCRINGMLTVGTKLQLFDSTTIGGAAIKSTTNEITFGNGTAQRIDLSSGSFFTFRNVAIRGMDNSSNWDFQRGGTGNAVIFRVMLGDTNNYIWSRDLKIGGLTIQAANTSSILDVESTTKGFLPPRMTSAQRTAISTPAIGLIVYQTDGTEGVYVNTSTGWKQLLM